MIPESILMYTIIGVALVIIVLVAWIIRLELKLKSFTLGSDGKSLEDTLQEIIKAFHYLDDVNRKEAEHRKNIETRLKKSIQGVGVVRFNPFKDSGGNQSFAAAFLNEHGDGVVISSLFARERMSIFAKPIEHLSSTYELTKEEKEAVQQASGKEEVEN